MPDGEDDSELSDAVEWYDDHLTKWSVITSRSLPKEVNEWLRGFLPHKAGFILGVGAGSGRDAERLSKDNAKKVLDPLFKECKWRRDAIVHREPGSEGTVKEHDFHDVDRNAVKETVKLTIKATQAAWRVAHGNDGPRWLWCVGQISKC